jgi:predicted outer membrane repeat protein
LVSARPPQTRRRPRRVALGVEALEERAVPAVVPVVNAADTLDAGTLRSALVQAQGDAARGQSDTITFDTDRMGTNRIVLMQGQLELNQSGSTTLTIDGGGKVTIDGNGGSRVFHVATGTSAVLQNLSITGGHAESAAGIANDGTLEVDSSNIFSNTATDLAGGIGNTGTLTLNSTTLSGNSSANRGGAIFTNPGTTVTLNQSTIMDNHSGDNAGGIENDGGTLVVNASTFSDNRAQALGGGIDNNGALVVTGSTFFHNIATGDGGGISNQRGSLTVSNSTFNANTAQSGGAITNVKAATATISSSTLAGNTALFDGGGINSMGTVPVKALDTIFANSATNAGQDIFGTIRGSNNLVRVGDAISGISNHDKSHNLVGTSDSPLDPHLGSLADNGGPTQTMALQAGSPALHAGGALAKLTSDLDSTNTKIHLDDASFAAAQGQTLIRVGDEFMLITGADTATNTITVERHVLSKTAVHTAGEGVFFALDQAGGAREANGITDIGAFEA